MEILKANFPLLKRPVEIARALAANCHYGANQVRSCAGAGHPVHCA